MDAPPPPGATGRIRNSSTRYGKFAPFALNQSALLIYTNGTCFLLGLT